MTNRAASLRPSILRSLANCQIKAATSAMPAVMSRNIMPSFRLARHRRRR